MKKVFLLVILICLIFFCYQFGVTFFKKTHEVSYTVVQDSNTFDIKETFKNNKYYLEIHQDDYIFYFVEKNIFGKSKQVIDKIEWNESDGKMCIYPIYKKETNSFILCSDKNKMYSYESMKSDSILLEFSTSLKEKGYNIPISSDYKEEYKKKDRITYYPSAIDEIFTLWNYQGFLIFEQDNFLDKDIFKFDKYENKHSVLVGKYYVVPIYINNTLFEFSSVYIFDVINNKDYNLKLPSTLSDSTYINGVVDEKLYLFDPKNIVQIEINPKEKSVKQIANKNKDALYYNGKWDSRNIYDFVSEKVKFTYFDDVGLKEKYSYSYAYENEDSYYFYDGSSMYKVYKDYMDRKQVLFYADDIKEIKVVDEYIYYISGNTIYKYMPNSSIKRVLTYDEFLYNYENVYDVYRK